MAIKVGQYYVCDRCGATTFAEKIESKELDGGYTQYDKFEEKKDWHYIYPDLDKSMVSKLLCPECSARYKKIIEDFLFYEKCERVCH